MKISSARLTEIFRAMDHVRIGVVGDLMLDVYISGTASRLSQEAPVPVLRVRSQETRLGGAANVMHNLTSLAPSAKVYAFGVAGADPYADTMCALLRERGISIEGIITDPTRRTTVKQRVIASGQQVVRMDMEDTNPIGGNVLKRLERRLLSGIRNGQFDALIFEDYAKGLLHADMLQRLADEARRFGIYTSLDPHPGHPMHIRGLSLMTPNRMEAFGLAGQYCTDPADRVEEDAPLRNVAKVLLKNWAPDSLLITLGHQGMALFRKHKKLLVIPTVAREVFDVSGAGDTVISTLTLCRAAGADEQEAAMISNQAAGIVVGKRGTATTTPAEIRAVMEENRSCR